MYINHIHLHNNNINIEKIKDRNIRVVKKYTSSAVEISFRQRDSPPHFSFARYVTINSDWRTRDALRDSRFKEGCACSRPSLVNLNQNSQFMERVLCAARHKIRCPNARKSDHPPDDE